MARVPADEAPSSPRGVSPPDSAHDVEKRLLVLEKAVETMQLGVTIVDTSGHIIYVNPADAEMHGYEPWELIGERATVFAAPGRSRRLSKPELSQLTSWRRESLNRHRDGDIFPVEILSDVVVDNSGEPIGIVSICRDLRPQQAAERALRESEERYTLAIRGANDGIWDWDLSGGRFFTSPRWQEILHCEPNSLDGTADDWFDRVHPEDRVPLHSALEQHLRGETPHFESEHRIRAGGNDYIWVLSRGVAVTSEGGEVTRLAGSLSDITGRKVTDPLTGLPNRVLFIDRLASALARTQRSRRYVGVLFVDLDRFKVVNDSLGHSVGDKLLFKVAQVFRRQIRRSDTVARLGGDEFAFLIEDIPGIAPAINLAEKIHAALAEPLHIAGKEIFACASIGLALGSSETDPEELLQQADTAMYDAKACGRGRHRIFDAALRVRAREQLSLETDLRKAIHERELEVYFQPIVDPERDQIRGFEALARWFHPERGLVPPNEFISVAENSGLIFDLGRWVLRESCRQLGRWQAEYPAAAELSMNVNVSPKQFNHPGLVDLIREALQESGIRPEALEIEIAESAFIDDLERASGVLEELQKLGIKVWLDDFGTGYSSLSYIHRFRVNGLKIDQSFVEQLQHAGREADLTRSIVNLARDLGIEVIAEGVETDTQVDCLRKLRCRWLQGFLFSRPVGADAAIALFQVSSRAEHGATVPTR